MPSVNQTTLTDGQFCVEEFTFRLDGSKTLLYFPVKGQPRAVRLPRLALAELDFAPYLTVRARGKAGRGHLRRTFVCTPQLKTFMFIFAEQTAKNRSSVNQFVTSALERLVCGFSRPWIGPLLVDFENEVVEFQGDDILAEVSDVLRHLHMVYEHVHPNDSIPFFRLPDNPALWWMSDTPAETKDEVGVVAVPAFP
ncbi:hypothetical protein VNI00_015259 [Paramarasmius palmivorus]|uniref:Uncharacterized protein n=1 Tax=Paramarasmius palmivorus TaxID=297713 RepID=A0AAW0BN53_9AGAR